MTMKPRNGFIVSAILLAGCSGPKPTAPQPPEPPVVTVANPQIREISRAIDLIGRTEAVKMVDIIPEVSGSIIKIGFRDGQMVNVGDLLYEIDPIPYKAMADKAAADVANAKAQLALAEADLARVRQAAASGSISKIEIDQVVAKRDSANAMLQASQAEVIRTSFNLSRTQITSPIAGRIERTLMTEGNLVTANSSRLTRIVTIHPIHVYYDVDEMTSLRYRSMIMKDKTVSDPKETTGLKAWIKLKNEDRYTREGTVDYIEAEVNRASATRTIRSVFPNEDGLMTPGESVRIRLEAGPKRPVILIPEIAIGSQQGQKYVYTINEKNEAMMTVVTLGEVRDGFQVVEKGLSATDRIVVNGLLRVRPGVTVKPVDAESQSTGRTN